MSSAHVIENLEFDIRFASEASAFDQQERLASFLKGRAMRVMEELFDRACAPGEVLSFESLELDLGGIAIGELESGFEMRLRQRLEAALADGLRHAREQASAQGTPVLQTARQAEFDAFIHFLARGHFSWRRVPGRSVSVASLAQRVLAGMGAELAQWLAASPLRIEAIRRMVSHCDDMWLDGLLDRLAVPWASDAVAVMGRLRSAYGSVGGSRPAAWRQAMWEAVLVEASGTPGASGAASVALNGRRARGGESTQGGEWQGALVQGALAAVGRSEEALQALRVEGIQSEATDAAVRVASSRAASSTLKKDSLSVECDEQEPVDVLLRQVLQASLLGPSPTGEWSMDIEQAWTVLLQTQPHWVSSVLLRLGTSVKVRRRLANHASESLLRKLVELLAPGQGQCVSDAHLRMLEDDRTGDVGGGYPSKLAERLQVSQSLIEGGRVLQATVNAGPCVPVRSAAEAGAGLVPRWRHPGVPTSGMSGSDVGMLPGRDEIEALWRLVFKGQRMLGGRVGKGGPLTLDALRHLLRATGGIKPWRVEPSAAKRMGGMDGVRRAVSLVCGQQALSSSFFDQLIAELWRSEEAWHQLVPVPLADGCLSHDGSSQATRWRRVPSATARAGAVNLTRSTTDLATRRPIVPLTFDATPLIASAASGPEHRAAVENVWRHRISAWPHWGVPARRGHRLMPRTSFARWKHGAGQTAGLWGRHSSVSLPFDICPWAAAAPPDMTQRPAPTSLPLPPTARGSDSPPNEGRGIHHRGMGPSTGSVRPEGDVAAKGFDTSARTGYGIDPGQQHDERRFKQGDTDPELSKRNDDRGLRRHSEARSLSQSDQDVLRNEPSDELSLDLPRSEAPLDPSHDEVPLSSVRAKRAPDPMRSQVPVHPRNDEDLHSLQVDERLLDRQADKLPIDRQGIQQPLTPQGDQPPPGRPHDNPLHDNPLHDNPLRDNPLRDNPLHDDRPRDDRQRDTPPHDDLPHDDPPHDNLPFGLRYRSPSPRSPTPVRTEPVEGPIPLFTISDARKWTKPLLPSPSTRHEGSQAPTLHLETPSRASKPLLHVPASAASSTHPLPTTGHAPEDRKLLWQFTLAHLLLEADAGFQPKTHLDSLQLRMSAHQGMPMMALPQPQQGDTPLSALWIRWSKFLHRGANAAWTPSVVQAWQELLREAPGHLRESLLTAGASATLRRSLAVHAPIDALKDLASLFAPPRQLLALTVLMEGRLFETSLTTVGDAAFERAAADKHENKESSSMTSGPDVPAEISKPPESIQAIALRQVEKSLHLDRPVAESPDIERLLWELALSHLLLDCSTGFDLPACVCSVIERLSLHTGIPAHRLAQQACDAMRLRKPMDDGHQSLLDALADAELQTLPKPINGHVEDTAPSATTADANASPDATTMAQVLAHLDGTSSWPSQDIATFAHHLEQLCQAATNDMLQPIALALERPRAADRLMASLPLDSIRRLVHRLHTFDSTSLHACTDLMLSALPDIAAPSDASPSVHPDESKSTRTSHPTAAARRQAKSAPDIAQRFILRHVFEEGRLFNTADFSRRLCTELASTLNPDRPADWRAALQRKLSVMAEAGEDTSATFARDIAKALSSVRDPEAPEPVTRTAWPMFSAPGAEPIYIANAGLVLLAPYLQRLFSMLKLVEQGAFIDHAAAQRAMQIGQFLVDGQLRSPEHTLVLNKLLCDVPIEAPIDGQSDLEPHEQDAALGLLKAVIQHWKALGKTSVAGLRESFLQREGRLTHSDAGWQLKVEPKAFDMLIDQLPWGFSTVKFPWMKEILHVDWR